VAAGRRGNRKVAHRLGTFKTRSSRLRRSYLLTIAWRRSPKAFIWQARKMDISGVPTDDWNGAAACIAPQSAGWMVRMAELSSSFSAA
jgi:hypothetical protein